MKSAKSILYGGWILISFFLILASCGKNKDGFSETESGLKYKFIKSSNGIKPELGDIMIMHITYRTDFDSLLFDSKTKSDSYVEPTFTGGVEEGFGMMSPGDTAIFKVSADSVFEKTFHTTLPSYLKPASLLTFHVKLNQIIPKSVHDSLERAMDVELRRKEFERIEIFLKQNNMDVMPTENGAYMVTSRQGSGEFPVKGDTVYATFTGRLLDGTIFDQSEDKKAPFKFVLGTNMVIQGWEECVPLLNKGAVARMVIPSDLSFGAQKYGTLPPYSTLVFDIEILEIKKGNRSPN
ncbi:MAG TPA: FKBP-type peptidyl-prolyl cis-trans isomerase [Bacteroidia bacterium]|nr:FKBP-type peptidyl-prolyl cis-trans isomerase [Bacteroidia bacterium]